MVSPVIFWLIAAVIVASAIAVVTLKNIVHSALFLILTFVGTAAIYILLHADFLALVQVLVYAGAIAVLIVFAVMITMREDVRQSNLFNKYKWIGALLSFGLFGLIGYLILASNFPIRNVDTGSTIEGIAEIMLRHYVIPFEIAAILLLIAMVGAIILGKGVKGQG